MHQSVLLPAQGSAGGGGRRAGRSTHRRGPAADTRAAEGAAGPRRQAPEDRRRRSRRGAARLRAGPRYTPASQLRYTRTAAPQGPRRVVQLHARARGRLH